MVQPKTRHLAYFFGRVYWEMTFVGAWYRVRTTRGYFEGLIHYDTQIYTDVALNISSYLSLCDTMGS